MKIINPNVILVLVESHEIVKVEEMFAEREEIQYYVKLEFFLIINNFN